MLAGTAIWGLAVATGFFALQLYKSSPGQGGRNIEHWPGTSRVPHHDTRPTLIVAVHPLCPCTQATVSELARVLTRCKGQVEVHVLVYLPEHAGHAWSPTRRLRGLGTMPGVHLVDDPAGEQAALFGARTSGLVALYGQDGRLLFRGGLTSARGHEGDSEGQRALLGLIQNNQSDYPRETCVYGCPISSVPSTFARSVAPWTK
jgi:hypothetical protein